MDYIGVEVENPPLISYLAQAKEECSFMPLTSLELLKQHGNKVKRLREGNLKELNTVKPTNSSGHQALSTAGIMKLARAQLFVLNSQKADVLSSVASCIGAQSALGSEFSEDSGLAILLQAAAENVVNQQYVYSRKLLNKCNHFSSKSGYPAQRIVHYFAEALREKIDQECGMVASLEDLEGETRRPIDEKLALVSLQPGMMASQQENPFSLVSQFTAIGSIRATVATARRVHLINFGLDNGSHWTLIMQDFAAQYNYPIELLKITAVGTSKQMMEETVKWLSAFADSISLPFTFNIVVSDLKDLKEDMFKLEADEVVAVYLDRRLWTLLAWPNYLEALIAVISKLKPRVMVVKEMEASTNNPIFLERFHEALIFFSGMFESIKDCMDNHIFYRKLTEEVYCRNMIRNIITAEGKERVHRHERVAFWRTLFAKFGFVETALSQSSFRRASMFLKRSALYSSFTIYMDGKCLILGWKRTPFISVSAWKFQYDSE
ncbi:DELLA protein RGL2-like isoform X2 [Coffea arabica]|nr:DELLA protein RGL2-like [Coffea arabica]